MKNEESVTVNPVKITAPQNKPAPQMTPRQVEAFEAYYAMGKDRRSYDRLAALMNTGAKTIFNWAKKYGWQDMIAKRDAEYEVRARRKTRNALEDQTRYFRSFWMRLLQECFLKDAAGEVQRDAKGNPIFRIMPKDIADAERITRMILQLSGHESARAEYVDVILDRVIRVIDMMIADRDARFQFYTKLSEATLIEVDEITNVPQVDSESATDR